MMGSVSRGLAAQKGTRVDPPKPFSVVLNAAPAKGVPLTLTTADAGKPEPNVESCDSCQLFNRYRPFQSARPESTGAQIEFTVSRCLSSSMEVAFSAR